MEDNIEENNEADKRSITSAANLARGRAIRLEKLRQQKEAAQQAAAKAAEEAAKPSAKIKPSKAKKSQPKPPEPEYESDDYYDDSYGSGDSGSDSGEEMLVIKSGRAKTSKRPQQKRAHKQPQPVVNYEVDYDRIKQDIVEALKKERQKAKKKKAMLKASKQKTPPVQILPIVQTETKTVEKPAARPTTILDAHLREIFTR